MIPAAKLAEQLALITHIDILTARDIVRAWQRLSPETRLSTALIPDLMSLVTEIATAYGEVTAVAAADFYDYMAELAGTRLPPAVPVSPVPPRAQVESMVRWATGPLRLPDGPLPDAALKRLTGAAQRLAQQPGRRTLMGACARDGVRFARVPQGSETCPYCLMLASRGAVYWTQGTAMAAYHDSCDCAVIAVHQDDDLPEFNQRLHSEWHEATRGRPDQIAAWREYVAATYQTPN